MIYWFTGQPGAGKTTLAKKLVGYLNVGNTIHIDGDDLRDIFKNKDYSENGRRANIQKAMDIAHFLNEKGYNVVASLVSPYKDLRDDLKGKSGAIEIYVHTTDIRGRENFHVKDYEPPTENYISINTTDTELMVSYTELINKLFL